MSKPRRRSLQWVLVRRLILLQAATLIAFIALLCAVLFIAQPRLIVDNEAAIGLIAEALKRDPDGRLVVDDTPELQTFRQDFPHLWFVARDDRGGVLRQGDVPDAYAKDPGDLLKGIDKAVLAFKKDLNLPEAMLRNADTRAGRTQIVASTVSSRSQTDGVEINIAADFDVARYPDGSPIWIRVIPILAIVVLIMLSPIIIVMGVTTLVTTPAVVRRSLAGLVATASQAKRIDIDNRAVQLPTEQVPTEIAPLVDAFNNALARLGEGYDRRNRFLTDAAHELRTPIAILRTRAELLRDDPESRRLLKDIERLSHLAQQLLDRQVLDYETGSRETLELVDFVRNITADFAPLAFGAGYDLSFDPAAGPVMVEIRPSQIHQAISNLLRNAIDHGGGSGTISVLVDASGGIEIRDEGPGIPDSEHERVFEPFYRLRPRSSGAGLGLNLAREIARLHGGRIDVMSGPWRGARVRIQLPLANVEAGAAS